MPSRVDFIVEKDKLTGLPAAVQAALSKLVAQTAATVEGRAKEAAPVDTGNLRNSITHETSGLTGVISVGADYAADMELGTYKSAAQPFLTPAVESERNAFRRGIADAINEAAS